MRIMSARIGRHVRRLAINYPKLYSSTVVKETEAVADGAKSFSEIPGPKGMYNIPYFGTALHFKPFTNYELNDLPEILTNMRDQYGDIVKMRIGRNYVVYIFDPDYTKTVLQLPYKEFFAYQLDLLEVLTKRTGLPKSLTLMEGKEWKELRKPAQEKMLRPAVVASYGPLIEQVTDDFIDILKRKKTIDDLQMTLSNYTTESVAMLCFNRRLGSIASEEPAEIVKCVSEVFTLLQKSMIMPFKTFKYFKTPLYKQAEMVRLRIQNIVEKELKAQLDVLNELKKENQLDDYLQKDPNFMYSLLADSRMTLGKITSIVTTLINAGIDSTANSMLFALSDLAFHQEKQQKLYQEIQTVVGDSKHLTKEHLAQMSFLKACIKESQRLTFPIMTGPARYMEWDTVVGGYTIPRKTLVSPDMAAMVKDERFFPKAKEYIPERWLRNVNDDITKGQEFPFAFKPFGFGPRGCIGQRFAEMEMQIGITKIIQNFEISMPPGVSEIKTVHRTFTSPAQKVTLQIHDRNI
ncbi:probable cytochrome P450 CYP44 [Mytilus edulis]|uniref:probable cytochrome P450 CYP44 n=1 Tax=Mytilus edulis TaxID=6550 RepID=UPI0039EE9EE0